MIIKQLLLNNFRNYENGCWQFSDGINVFYGNNGQGKTNVLESIYFSALGFSHRTFQEAELINMHSDNMSIITSFENINAKRKITIKKIGKRSRKEISIDNNVLKPRELIGQLKVTIFSPEDLQLVKSDPSLRRRFLDMQISQIDGKYCFSLAKYNKILQHRNKLLLDMREKNYSDDTLDVWDEQFAKVASYILQKRLQVISILSDLSAKIYKDIAGNNEVVNAVYKVKENPETPIFDIKNSSFETIVDWYLASLKDRRKKDIERSYTGLGPHRDDIIFNINDKPIKSFGSQGQQRSFVLALKIAEIQLIKDSCDEYPVLLLDDVMSELDAGRKRNLLDFLNGKVQTFITLTEKELIDNFVEAKYYKVQQGSIIEEI